MIGPRFHPAAPVEAWSVAPSFFDRACLLTLAAVGLASAGLASATPVAAQDIELLAQLHGSRPPSGYFEQMRRNPDSFRFRREGPRRLDALRSGMRGSALGGRFQARVLGPREDPVVGTFNLPLVLGLFTDGPQMAPFTVGQVQAEFFDGPNSYYQTLPEFYSETSGGLFDLVGTTFDWQTTGLSRADVTLGQSALISDTTQGVGAFVESIVQALDDAGVDWTPFDQSGDGYVDVIAVIHTDPGAECNSATNRIWSHRWTLAEATAGRLPDGFETSTPRPGGGGNIRIDDYIIQPLMACDGEDISEIGTFAHELGHGFGLPDLYRTASGGFFAGVGNWDLMGTGGWGCRGGVPERPCQMGAWSKFVLGWLEVDEVPAETDEVVTLEPVETAGRALRLSARDGSNEYLLVENRQRIGFDGTLAEPGLLIWHVDQDVLDQKWASNFVNSDASRMGVWLRQADGRDDLTSSTGGRGDRGDPFPGCIKPSSFDDGDPSVPCTLNQEFHAGKAPMAISHQGGGLGTTLLDIELLGSEPHDVQFRLNTQVSAITLESERDGAKVNLEGFEVDGIVQGPTPLSFVSAPFQSHTVAAAGGIPTGPDRRISFLEWEDGASRTREVLTQFSDQTLVAVYRDEEIRLGVTTNEPAHGITPGTFTSDPGGKAPEDGNFWFPEGTVVSILADARTGFVFREWAGVATPLDNPVSFTLEGPSDIRADFDVVYAVTPVPGTVELEAGVEQQIVLTVTEGNAPVTWTIESGVLPRGLNFASETGVISGTATELGQFALEILARDGIGLEARVALALLVERPSVSVDLLVRGFLEPGTGTSAPLEEFLDAEGNMNGTYDVGDLRAYLLANPELPDQLPVRHPTRTVVPLGPMRPPISVGVEDDAGDPGREPRLSRVGGDHRD